REPREFQLYSAGSRDRSAKRISRGSLQIAILALTVGATTGAGVVLALLGHPSHQYTASLTARPIVAYASPMNSPSLQIAGAPDPLGQMTNRTSAWDMPSSLAGAANEEDARQTGRKTFRYIRVTHRFTHRQHRYRYAFHRYAFWHRYRYAFHSLRKG